MALTGAVKDSKGKVLKINNHNYKILLGNLFLFFLQLLHILCCLILDGEKRRKKKRENKKEVKRKKKKRNEMKVYINYVKNKDKATTLNFKAHLLLTSTSAMKASSGSSSLSEPCPPPDWICFRVGEFSAGM